MKEERQRRIIITKKGQQIPVESGPGITVTIALAGDDVKQDVVMNVSDEEFDEMRKQALTNKIPAAILKKRKVD